MSRLSRRLLLGGLFLLAAVGALLVVPVLTRSGPAPHPVKAATETVVLGSVGTPAGGATVRAAAPPASAAPASAPAPDPAPPVLTVTRTGLKPFSLVGVSWADDPGVTGTEVRIRVQGARGGWGSWTTVGVDGGDQDAQARPGATVRGGAAPLWTGPSTGVQVELTTRSGAQPTDVRLDLVDPGTSPADASLGAPDATAEAHAATTMPPVYSRAQWGADESVRSWDPQYAATISAATLHHTADANGYAAEQVPAILRAIYQYHAVTLGWGDIGYNVLVDRFGRLWEGRYGGLGSTVIGAHAGGFNTGTFGVSMMGNYDTVDTPQPMIDAVSRIIAWKFLLYGVDPNGTTVLTARNGAGTTAKYADGTKVTLPTIFGHRDVGNTACPGRYGYARLPQIRSQVSALMAAQRTPIENRYWNDAALRSSLGAPSGGEQSLNGVTWQVYANGRLYSSAAGGVRVVRGGILDTYLADGGPAALGAPVSDDAWAGGDGWFVKFQYAYLYWSPSTGVQKVSGDILWTWLAWGGTTGALGYPTTSDALTPDGRGFSVRFQGGDVYWSGPTGAQVVRGGIRDTWLAAGGPAGVLGFPTTSDAPAAGGGYYTRFQGGDVYWSPATGVQIVRGGILDTWLAWGGSGGTLGFPTTSDAATPDGHGFVVRFQRGDVYWSAPTGTQVVRGGIRDAWIATGGPGGPLGYPTTSDAPAAGGGYFTRFQGGEVYWSPPSGVHVVRTPELGTWLAWGGSGGTLGFPTADSAPTTDGGGTVTTFQRGDLYSSAATGTQVVRGGIRDTWVAAGGTGGPLGYPTTSDAPAAGGGYWTRFQHGDVYWSPASGSHYVSAPLAAAYASRGAGASVLGFPVADTRAVTGGLRSDFQHGNLVVDTTTGTVIMTVTP